MRFDNTIILKNKVSHQLQLVIGLVLASQVFLISNQGFAAAPQVALEEAVFQRLVKWALSTETSSLSQLAVLENFAGEEWASKILAQNLPRTESAKLSRAIVAELLQVGDVRLAREFEIKLLVVNDRQSELNPSNSASDQGELAKLIEPKTTSEALPTLKLGDIKAGQDSFEETTKTAEHSPAFQGFVHQLSETENDLIELRRKTGVDLSIQNKSTDRSSLNELQERIHLAQIQLHHFAQLEKIYRTDLALARARRDRSSIDAATELKIQTEAEQTQLNAQLEVIKQEIARRDLALRAEAAQSRSPQTTTGSPLLDDIIKKTLLTFRLPIE